MTARRPPESSTGQSADPAPDTGGSRLDRPSGRLRALAGNADPRPRLPAVGLPALASDCARPVPLQPAGAVPDPPRCAIRHPHRRQPAPRQRERALSPGARSHRKSRHRPGRFLSLVAERAAAPAAVGRGRDVRPDRVSGPDPLQVRHRPYRPHGSALHPDARRTARRCAETICLALRPISAPARPASAKRLCSPIATRRAESGVEFLSWVAERYDPAALEAGFRPRPFATALVDFVLRPGISATGNFPDRPRTPCIAPLWDIGTRVRRRFCAGERRHDKIA